MSNLAALMLTSKGRRWSHKEKKSTKAREHFQNY